MKPLESSALERALLSLEGLSVGDAFGEQFFSDNAAQLIRKRVIPSSLTHWPYTDDTHMALSIVETLKNYGKIDQDFLANRFARRYMEEPWRGYAGGAVRLLIAVGSGSHWKDESQKLFGGAGSYGNGAAMRVAPVGAYFAGNFELARENAMRSAEVTHAHPEGIAGAVAVAIAAACAWKIRIGELFWKEFLQTVIDYTPKRTLTLKGIVEANQIPYTENPSLVAKKLGSGYDVSAQDTVPFALWCAAGSLDDYGEAIWKTVSGFGDMDTTCAIVGGIVALSAEKGIPDTLLKNREKLPQL